MFEVGDIVRVIGIAGPNMKIFSKAPVDDNNVAVVGAMWFCSNNHMHECIIDESMLEKIPTVQ